MTLERLPSEVVCRSGHKFATEQALDYATIVYGQFSTSARAMEHLARLSVSSSQSSVKATETVLGSCVVGLEQDKYIIRQPDSLRPFKLTPLGIVAVNLVKGTLFGEDVDAELREPFLTVPVLDLLPHRVHSGGTVADADSFHQTFSEDILFRI